MQFIHYKMSYIQSRIHFSWFQNSPHVQTRDKWGERPFKSMGLLQKLQRLQQHGCNSQSSKNASPSNTAFEGNLVKWGGILPYATPSRSLACSLPRSEHKLQLLLRCRIISALNLDQETVRWTSLLPPPRVFDVQRDSWVRVEENLILFSNKAVSLNTWNLAATNAMWELPHIICKLIWRAPAL
jgi:hypothetical protein